MWVLGYVGKCFGGPFSNVTEWRVPSRKTAQKLLYCLKSTNEICEHKYWMKMTGEMKNFIYNQNLS